MILREDLAGNDCANDRRARSGNKKETETGKINEEKENHLGNQTSQMKIPRIGTVCEPHRFSILLDPRPTDPDDPSPGFQRRFIPEISADESTTEHTGFARISATNNTARFHGNVSPSILGVVQC